MEIIVQGKLGEKYFNRNFTFDQIFKEETKQKDIYKTVVKPIINDVLKGYHCTVFAYGQTGTGKTYTIEGERSNKLIPWEQDALAGIIPRSLFNIFKDLSKYNGKFSVRISAIQIYNEEIFDLLNENDSIKLKLFEDSSLKGSVLIQGLKEVIVDNIEQAYCTVEKAMFKRQTNATLTHGTSSRSHAIFTISVSTKTNAKTELFTMGKLTLVDLAGSENIGRSGAVDKQAREAGSINQSLLTLHRVTMALEKKATHIPYRESKLTRLLQDSLGGHCKTTLIATISPAANNIEETLSTLEYASLAKNVVNHPKANQKAVKATSIKNFTLEISHLQRDLYATIERTGINLSEDTYNALTNELTNTRKTFNEKSNEVEKLQEKLEEINFQVTNSKNELSEKEIDFNKCKKHLEKALFQLKNNSKKLNTVQNKLHKSLHDFESVKSLVKYQRKSEANLKSHATKILHVVENSTSDADLLHSKLERKNQLEKTNNHHLQNMRSDILEKINSMQIHIEEMNQKHESSYNNLKINFDALVEMHRKNSNNIYNILTEFQNSYSKNVLHLINSIKFEGEEGNNWCDNQLKMINESTPLFENIMMDMKTKMKSVDVQQIVHNFNLIKEIKMNLRNNLENSIKIVQNNVNEQNTLIAKIETLNKKYEENQKDKSNSSEIITLHLQDSSTDLIEKWNNVYEKFKYWFEDFKKITEKCRTCNNYIPKHIEKIRNVKYHMKKNEENFFSNSDKLEESTDSLKDSLTSLTEAWKVKVENEIEQIMEVSKTRFLQNELLQENIKNLSSIIEIDFNKNFQKFKNSVDDYSKKSAFDLRQSQAEINDVYNIVNKTEDDYNKMLHVQKELQTNHINSQFTVLLDITNKNQLQSEEYMTIIKSFESNIKNCLDHFQQYTPTGKTPVRKAYSFSKNLPFQINSV